MFEKLSFPVELMDLPHPNPQLVQDPNLTDADRQFVKIPSRKAIVRQDTGDVLNIVSAKYPLVRHGDLFNTMQDAITTMGLPVTDVKESSANNGGMAKVTWTLDKGFEIPGHGLNDVLKTTITVHNSYDYASIVAVDLGTYRLICSNGASVGELFAAGRKKHVPSIKVPELIKAVTDELAKVDAVRERLVKWAEIDYPRTRFEAWLEKTPIAKPARQEILDYYTTQPDRTKTGAIVVLNGWEAVNAITWYATHRIKQNKAGSTMIAEDRFLALANSFTTHELAA